MTDRIKRMKERITNVRTYPICTEKMKIVLDDFIAHEGFPIIWQRAHAQAKYLDEKTIFIQDDELIAGNFAKVPMGLESVTNMPTWPDDDLDTLIRDGVFIMSDEDRKALRAYDKYWLGRGMTKDEKQGFFYDNEDLWNFIQRGFLCPPWKDKKVGRGMGAAGQGGWGHGLGFGTLYTPDYGYCIRTGVAEVIRQCEEELKNLKMYNQDGVEKYIYLKSALLVLPAFVRLAHRYGDACKEAAEKTTDPKRKAELLQMAETCYWVPEHPARTFREAVQSFFFFFCMYCIGTAPGGRFDEYMGPYYEADVKAGRITYDEALELVECLRMKVMEYNQIAGGAKQREKWAGMARWHNFIIGGTDENGNDITNPVSYMLLDAALETQTPQHTITVRVHEGTPKELMHRALEVVKSGLGMPAFISEKEYRQFALDLGASYKDANDFAICGCLDMTIPGRSRGMAIGMFETPCVLELAMFDGKNPATGIQHGPQTGTLGSFKNYEDFYQAFLAQMKKCMGYVCEEHNVLSWIMRTYWPDVTFSIFAQDGVKAGKDILSRHMVIDNTSQFNFVGLANTINSLASLKKLVFDEKLVSPEKMEAAIRANWVGYEDVRKLCLDAPKFGNNDDFVDDIAVRLFNDLADLGKQFTDIDGYPMVVSGISITAHAPGGSYTGATPDGRAFGETFADGSTSPVQGTDTCGCTAVLNSMMKLPAERYQATLQNMKFHPTALKTDEDIDKLGEMLKVYLTHGGKHIQMNVIDAQTMIEAKKDKEKYKDLVVRVAGYSSYFTVLTPRIQDEIIARTAHDLD